MESSRQSYSESRSLVYKDVTEYLTQKFTRNANYRCVFISSVGGDEPVHAYAARAGYGAAQSAARL